jgi:microcystin-dependent protein
MPYPPFPSRVSNFQQAENAGQEISTSNLDADLNNLVECLTQTQDVLRGVTTATGQLRNQSVATAQSLVGAERFSATASQTVFTTAIEWSASFTNLNVSVTSQGVEIDPNLVSVADNGGFLEATIPAQTVSNIVVVKAFESGAGLTTTLASTSTGEGASTIGVEDSAALYSATNVEAALAEVRVALNSLVTSLGTIGGLIRDDGSVPFADDQDMGGNKITGLLDGTAATDAATVGQITENAGALADLELAAVLRDGTQAFTGNQDLGGFKLTGLGAPASDGDATNKTYVDGLLTTAAPTGTIVMYAGSSAPTGWLICNGQAVSRTGATLDLFNLLLTTFGAGDGTTTFNVPDFRGRGPVGVGTGEGAHPSNVGTGKPNNTTPSGGASLPTRTMGEWFGEATHVQTVAELAAHTHTIEKTNGNYGSGGINSIFVNSNGIAADGATDSTGSSTAMNVTDPKLVVNFIIKT